MLDFAAWGAISSVVERFLHTEEATGSIPVSPTIPLFFDIPTMQFRSVSHNPSRCGQMAGCRLHFTLYPADVQRGFTANK
jgi:hypothetical protein